MKVRGERECQDCGTRWSYYETGSVACPDCDGLRSVGVGDRALHTDSPADLDLTSVRNAVDDEPLAQVAERAADQTRAFTRKTGFVDAGDLRPLSTRFLAAVELRTVATSLAHEMRPDEATELYFLELLQEADEGERPTPDEVPDALRAERGLAVAAAVSDYRSDLRTYIDDRGLSDGSLATVLSQLTARRKRIEALDGDVDPARAEQLVRVLEDVYLAVAEDDETALARALERLD
ncbi:TFIIB-type zinc ribbon-containing protein [Halobacteriales archaeon Cl-PHB]